MRVLHVTTRFHPCRGGVERHVEDLAALQNKTMRADVLCLDRCEDDGPRLPARSTVGKVNVFRVPYTDLRYYKIAPRILRYVKNYDVLHVHRMGFFLDFLCLTKSLHKKRLVFTTHGGIFHT